MSESVPTTTAHIGAPPREPVAVVNGEPYPLDGAVALTDLVARIVPGCVVDGRPQGVAVALDGAVVPRGAWASTDVEPGARVEVVTAVQGG